MLEPEGIFPQGEGNQGGTANLSKFVPEADIRPQGLFILKGKSIMNQIRISDVTMKQTGAEISLSFKEKIELSKN